MPDSRLTDEMIEAAAKALHDLNDPLAPWEEAPSVWRFQYKRAYAEPILAAVAPLLPDEAAIRADERVKCADEWSKGQVASCCIDCALKDWRKIKAAARGSAAATEETR